MVSLCKGTLQFCKIQFVLPLTASSPLTAGVSTIMDKNTEVLVCGSSIMKDVWEIRLREHRQKRQLEEERVRKSALERWGPAESLIYVIKCIWGSLLIYFVDENIFNPLHSIQFCSMIMLLLCSCHVKITSFQLIYKNMGLELLHYSK